MSTSLTLFLVPGDFPDLDDLCDLDLDPESEPVGFVLVACFTFFSASSFSRRAAALCAGLGDRFLVQEPRGQSLSVDFDCNLVLRNRDAPHEGDDDLQLLRE